MNEQYKNKIIHGDCLEVLKTIPDGIVNCCVTSPPYYGLRDYGEERQIGLEDTPEEYIEKLVNVFHEVKRVLKDDGTFWLNIADSYAGGQGRWGGSSEMSEKQVSNTGSLSQIKEQKKWNHSSIKPKDLIGIPWMLAFALRDDGWYLRQDIIWHKPNPMPESVKDRCTKSHEYIFLLSKNRTYYYDADAIKEPTLTFDENVRDRDSTKLNNTPGRTRMGGLVTNQYEMRNKRDVWSVTTKPLSEAHFATFPDDLIEPCILAGCPHGGIVLDCFFGSGTTGKVAYSNGRNFLGIELNKEYIEIAERRTLNNQMNLFAFL